MGRGEKSLLCDPGSELRLGGRENRRAKITNGMDKRKNKTKNYTINNVYLQNHHQCWSSSSHEDSALAPEDSSVRWGSTTSSISNRWQWKRDVAKKASTFKDTRQTISVPLAVSTNLRGKSFKLFQNPPQNNSWADLGPRSVSYTHLTLPTICSA